MPWWSASKGCCRAWFIVTWRPTGPEVLWMSCRPCCALITPHITVPWHGAARRELGRCRASLGMPVLPAMSTTHGRPGPSATCTLWPHQDEQDPSPVRQRLQRSLVQGDISRRGRARPQSCDLRCGRWHGWTNQRDFLWPRTPEGHATRLFWHGIHLGHTPAGEHHRVPD